MKQTLKKHILIVLLLLLHLSIFSQSAENIKTIASYPNGTFLENLAVSEDGSIFFTNYFQKEIERIDLDEEVSTFANIPFHPASILSIPEGFVIAGHEVPFIEGQKMIGTCQVLILDKYGKKVNQISVSDAAFLNGMTKLNDHEILIADSMRGVIWKVNLKSASWSKMYQSDQLKPKTDPFLPGVNGIKIHKNKLYFSSSAKGAIMYIALDKSNNPRGKLKLLSKFGFVDDFIFLKDGGILAATHGDDILYIDKKGEVKPVMSGGANGVTAVALSKDDTSGYAYATTTGKLLEGGKKEATVLRFELPATMR